MTLVAVAAAFTCALAAAMTLRHRLVATVLAGVGWTLLVVLYALGVR